MYTIVDEFLIDEVGIDSLSPPVRKKIDIARKALQSDSEPASYRWQKHSDGSFELVIPVGIQRLLLGYDVDEEQQVIFLNYLKSDWVGGAIDWFGGLFGAEPGGKK